MVPRKLTDEQQSVSLHLKSEAEENLLLLGAGVEGNYYNQKKTVFACGTTNKDEGHPFGVPGMFGIHKLCWPVDTSSSVGVVEEIQARSAWLQAAQAECLALVDSSKETFWIGADRSLLAQNATTRTTGLTALENFALSIFEYYTQTQSVGEGGEEGGDVVFDRGASGAEFWVQVKKSPPEKSESAIDVHYDKVLHIGYNIHDTHTHTRHPFPTQANSKHSTLQDESLSEAFRQGVFPFVSSVTYLSDTREGPPTVVLDTTFDQEVGSPIAQTLLCYPEV